MSRGPGKLQRFWMEVANVHAHFGSDAVATKENYSRLWTFDEICRDAFREAYEPGFEMRASFKRSLYRALARCVEERVILMLQAPQGQRKHGALYCINPSLLRGERIRDREELFKLLKPYGFQMIEHQLFFPHHH